MNFKGHADAANACEEVNEAEFRVTCLFGSGQGQKALTDCIGRMGGWLRLPDLPTTHGAGGDTQGLGQFTWVVAPPVGSIGACEHLSWRISSAGRHAGKIGRGSCRERVCEYVWI